LTADAITAIRAVIGAIVFILAGVATAVATYGAVKFAKLNSFRDACAIPPRFTFCIVAAGWMIKADLSYTGITEQIQSKARLAQIMFAFFADSLAVASAAFLTRIVLGATITGGLGKNRTVITGILACRPYGSGACVELLRSGGSKHASSRSHCKAPVWQVSSNDTFVTIGHCNLRCTGHRH
jgi:hypothetical protein